MVAGECVHVRYICVSGMHASQLLTQNHPLSPLPVCKAGNIEELCSRAAKSTEIAEQRDWRRKGYKRVSRHRMDCLYNGVRSADATTFL